MIHHHKQVCSMNFVEKLSLDPRQLEMHISDFDIPAFHVNNRCRNTLLVPRNMRHKRRVYVACPEPVGTRCDFPSKRTKFCFQW